MSNTYQRDNLRSIWVLLRLLLLATIGQALAIDALSATYIRSGETDHPPQRLGRPPFKNH